MKKINKQSACFIGLRRGIPYCLLLLAAALSSCKKFVQVPSPDSQLVTATVFSNNATATAAVTGIYTQMYNNNESFNISQFDGELADELKTYQNPPDPYYLDFTNAPVSTTYGEWVTAYSYIYQANAVIAGLNQYRGTSPIVKQQLTGEAYFIRAFWHLYLTSCFGAVPVALTTDYTVTSKLARTSRVQVLQQVISDLNAAIPLLNGNYVDASDTLTTTQRVTPNKAVAQALLARAYLYLGNYNNNDMTAYKNAEAAASSVISNSSYSLCTNLSGANSVFLANSSEAIWQLYTPLPSNYDTPDGYFFILTSAPSSGQYTISPQLMNAFERGDERRTNWIDSINAGGITYYFPYKYQNNTFTGTEYNIVLRLAEQYLIRAEARAEQGETAAAIADLNAIRNRAGLPNYAGVTDQSSLLTAILHERQVELFTEWGQRWFDLNRAVKNNPNGVNANSVMGSPGDVCKYKGGTWNSDDHQELYPIPQSEITIDHNLIQNPGY